MPGTKAGHWRLSAASKSASRVGSRLSVCRRGTLPGNPCRQRCWQDVVRTRACAPRRDPDAVRAGPHGALLRRTVATRARPIGGQASASRGARVFDRAWSGSLGRARSSRASRERRDGAPPLGAGRHADAARARRGKARLRRTEEPRSRCVALHQREDRRVPPRERLPQAWCQALGSRSRTRWRRSSRSRSRRAPLGRARQRVELVSAFENGGDPRREPAVRCASSRKPPSVTSCSPSGRPRGRRSRPTR